MPYYREDALDRIARHRASLSVAEFASLLDDLRALVRAGAVSPSTAMAWVRYGAASRDWNVLGPRSTSPSSTATRSSPMHRGRCSPRSRATCSVRARGRSVSSASRARATTTSSRAARSCALSRRTTLNLRRRRAGSRWRGSPTARRSTPDLVDVVLVTAARTGDAAMLEAMVPAAKSTQDRLERRNLTMALLSFDDPALAQKGLGILLDPSFDVRETWTALRTVQAWNPARRAPHDFIVANFDALARTVGRDTPGGWPRYAAGFVLGDGSRASRGILGDARSGVFGCTARARRDDRVDRPVHAAASALIRAADDRQRYSECRRPRP